MLEDNDDAFEAKVPEPVTDITVEGGATPPSGLFQGFVYRPQPLPHYIGMSTGVTGDTIKVNASSVTRATLCGSKTQMATSIGLKLAGGVILGENAGVSAKTMFLNSVNMSGQDITIVVYSKRIPHILTAQNPRFNCTIQPSDPRWPTFFGDAWVSSITLASEFMLVYRFVARDVETRNKILMSLKAEGVLAGIGINFGPKFTAGITNALSYCESSLHYQTFGISSPPFFNPTKTDVYEFCERFLQLPADAPTVTDIGWSYYNTIPR